MAFKITPYSEIDKEIEITCEESNEMGMILTAYYDDVDHNLVDFQTKLFVEILNWPINAKYFREKTEEFLEAEYRQEGEDLNEL